MRRLPLLALAAVATSALSVSGALAHAAAIEDVDLVTLPLPGYPSALPSRWHSGYLDAGEKDGKRLWMHYVLVESERDPAKDPVLVWTNGGPGAASLFGLLAELGPLLFAHEAGEWASAPRARAEAPPRLERNRFSWSATANLLVLNSPPPVGFSYCDPPGPAGGFTSCGPWNDGLTARHNRIAVESFARKFPSLERRDFFFAGESYSGVYTPTLVRELLRSKSVRVRGMAVGNGCVGVDVLCWAPGDAWWRIEFLRGHAQISDKSYERLVSECGPQMRGSRGSPQCVQRAQELERLEAGGFYEYNLYSTCAAKDPRFRGKYCGDDASMAAFVRLPDAKRALNVAPDAAFHDGDNGAGFEYASDERDLRPFYVELALKHKDVRVLVYSGDTDVSVNVFATQNWTRSLGLRETAAWRPWAFDPGFVAGYLTQYEGLDVVTFRGSGHFVPEFRAAAAADMVRRWLEGKSVRAWGGGSAWASGGGEGVAVEE